MIISKVSLWNFRKFRAREDGTPGLSVSFQKGLNALIGENDAGKSAIIDAIKMVLQTQSGEYIKVIEEDFYTDIIGNSVDEFSVECVFDEFTESEAKNFIEWLTFFKNIDTGEVKYSLKLYFKAWKEKNRIFTELKAGTNEEGVRLDGKARELLKCIYLRPLRDAAREMSSGRNSRISQILFNHPLFVNKSDHELVTILKEANEKIEKYFTEESGNDVLGRIRDTLKEFLISGSSSEASLKTSNMKLKAILESLSLSIAEIQPGLGTHNLLFIAAELLLLNHDENNGLKLALIEELEAHLHPQAQLRLISYLQKEYDDSGIQVIISTHSTILASKINIKNIILCKNEQAFSLSPENTKLNKGDYLFLQRFLDVTKANLFFAQGVIMVEGDAENLLIPVLADILDLNLEKHGVSVVNVGSVAFLRYSNIFKRNDGTTIGIPVSIVTDSDIEPKYIDGHFEKFDSETTTAIEKKKKDYDFKDIKTYVAPRWTLEYSLALSTLNKALFESILYAKKIQNSDTYALTAAKIKSVDEEVKQCFEEWEGKDPAEVAYIIYHDIMLDKAKVDKCPNKISKAITAQCLANYLRWKTIKVNEEEFGKEKMFDFELNQTNPNKEEKEKIKKLIETDEYLKYLVQAIKHATGIEAEMEISKK